MSSSAKETSSQIINPEASKVSNIHVSPEEIRSQGEILRVKTKLQLKGIEDIWKLAEQDLEDYFNNYKPLPHSNINVEELFEMPHVKIFRSDNKVYFGQIEHKKKHGKGRN